MEMKRFISCVLGITTILSAPLIVRADGFGINTTRLIYPGEAKSINVTVRNTLTDTPYLVQAAVSRQQDKQEPAPFTVMPPIFRLEPQSVNQLRIVYNGSPLPADRESVFYFHATAIPGSKEPLNNTQGGIPAQVRFGVGNIIKLFYRPASLGNSSSTAQKGLQFSSVAAGIKVTNPSPFYVSFSSVRVGNKKLALKSPAALMLPPQGSYTWQMSPLPAKGTKVQWQTINDSGGIDAFSANLP